MKNAKNAHQKAGLKDKTVGQRRPFTPREVQVIRYTIEREQNVRGLALFNTAIGTMLRSSDLLALRVDDVINPKGGIISLRASAATARSRIVNIRAW